MERARAKPIGAYLLVIAGACAFYLLNASVLLGHYDLGWHLAAGDLIRQQGSVPLHDPWAFTSAGQRWFNLSWLWDVLASLTYQHTHFAGLVVMTVACGAAIAGWLTAITLRAGAIPLATCVAVLVACVLYPSFSTFPNIYLAASPNLATMLFFIVFLGECLWPSRRLLLLPLAMLLWANLHGGFMQGLFLIGFFGLGALVRRDHEKFLLFLIAGIGCVAATLMNPLGWHIYQGVAATLGNPVQGQIGEWRSYYYNIHIPESLPGVFYILLFVIVELRYRTPCPVEVRMLSWLFLIAGLYQFRYLAFFFLFSAIPIALWLSRVIAVGRNVRKPLLAAGLVLTCVLPLAYWHAMPGFALPQMVSQDDVRFLETRFPHARLLNNWNFGGLLIFYDRGAVPLFVDGRAATAYPQSVLQDAFDLGQPEVNPATWDRVLKTYRIDTVLWVKDHEALRRFLVGARGWKEAYRGQYVSLYARPGL